MTYKGAIYEVKMLFQNPMMPDIFKPSLNKIAETLEMEKEIQPCEDCISRQAVLDSFRNKYAGGFDSDRWWNSMSVLYVINKVPPVQPIRPKGKWEEWIDRNDYNDFESISYVCNKCHHIQLAATNFCSNCGARMEREGDKE